MDIVLFFVIHLQPIFNTFLCELKKYSSTTGELIALVNSGAEFRDLLVKSIAKAKAVNPSRDTNPAQSLEEFFDFIEWSLTTLPRFILKLPTGSSLYDHLDQGVDYFYFLVDQPLEELEGKGYYYPSLQYHEPMRSWIVKYCKQWGKFLSTPESWNEEYAADFYADPAFGVPHEWYEPSSNWKCFNDFFSRRLRDASQRPIASPEDPGVVASPVDGYPQGVWTIDPEGYIKHGEGVLLKSRKFDLVSSLIGPGSGYADAFAGGTLTHVFLDVNDYHRYHFPVSGVIKEMRTIAAADAGGGVYKWDAEAGRYWLDCRTPGWESVETRACIILDTGKSGLVALLPIGMSQICSVNFSEGLHVGSHVEKGQEMGYFLFGGSDFVTVFQKGVEFSLEASTTEHIRTGERLGTIRQDKD